MNACWRQIGPILLAMCSCLASANPESQASIYTIDRAPPWVFPVDLSHFPTVDLATRHTMQHVLRDVQVDVSAKTTVYTHIVVKPLDSSGISELQKLKIPFDPSYQVLTLHEVKVVRGETKVQVLTQDQISVSMNEVDPSRQIYDQTVTLTISLGALMVNDLVEYSYSISGTNPALGQSYSAWFALGYEFPVALISIHLRIPSSRFIQHKAFPESLVPIEAEHDAFREFQWTVKSTKPVIEEDDLPNGFNPYPRLQISEYENWSQVQAWARPLFADDEVGNLRVAQLVNPWHDTVKSKKEWLKKALEFVQRKIRYVAIEMGEHSHRPLSASQVLEQGFGDCKDKSQLLVAMLRQGGIEADSALVSQAYRRGMAAGLPSPQVFDHVIVLANIDGTDYWLDPTVSHPNDGLQVIDATHFGKALIVGSGGRALVDMPAPPQGSSSVHIDEEFHLDGVKRTAMVTVKSHYRGQSATQMRAIFAGTPSNQWSKKLANDYATRYPSAKLQSFKHEDFLGSDEISLIETYELPSFFDVRRDESNFNLVVYGWGPRTFIRMPQNQTRTMPLRVPYPLSVLHNIEIHFDNAFEDFKPNDSQDIENPSFTFRYKKATLPGHLAFQYSLETRVDSVLPDDVGVYLNDLRNARELAKQTVQIHW